jgi:HSP20 family protein
MTADVYETVDGDAYVVEVPVPGVDVNDLSVEATPDDLTVSLRAPERNGQPDRRYLQHEQGQGPMSRVFEFPTEIDPDNISATLEAGMLKIHVPKAAASRRRVIPLKQ